MNDSYINIEEIERSRKKEKAKNLLSEIWKATADVFKIIWSNIVRGFKKIDWEGTSKKTGNTLKTMAKNYQSWEGHDDFKPSKEFQPTRSNEFKHDYIR